MPFVQGGCIGFPAETGETIWSSGMLDDQAINEHPHTTWGVGFSRYMPDRGLISVDKMMGYIAYRLGISAVRHEDIYSHWYVNKGNARPRHFAVTHPHKLPDCRSEIALDEQGSGATPATLRGRDDLTPPINPAWTGQFAQPLVPPGVDWPAAGLSQPTVMAGGERGIPAADTVVLIWDDDTWHAVRHLCNLQRSQRGASSGRYLLARGNGATALWYRAQGPAAASAKSLASHARSAPSPSAAARAWSSAPVLPAVPGRRTHSALSISPTPPASTWSQLRQNPPATARPIPTPGHHAPYSRPGWSPSSATCQRPRPAYPRSWLRSRTILPQT